MTAIIRLIKRSSIASDNDIEALVTISIFVGTGLFFSIGLLILDHRMHANWF